MSASIPSGSKAPRQVAETVTETAQQEVQELVRQDGELDTECQAEQ